jgi:hypothetical protein
VRNTVQYKARCVSRGFNQIEGKDYKETYSLVVNFRSMQTLLTISAYFNYEIHQLDYDAGFLSVSLKEEVSIYPIGTFDSRVKPGEVYKLHKTLYGLKKPPREWWMLLRDTQKSLDWTQTLVDQCIFYRDKPTGRESCGLCVSFLEITTRA